MLPLTFADPKDYDTISNEGDKISLVGLSEIAPGKVSGPACLRNIECLHSHSPCFSP